MEIVFLVFGIIAGFALLLIATSLLTVWADIQAAKRLFTTLPKRSFYRNSDQIYSHQYKDRDDGFVWFSEDNSFCLDGKHYLHNAEYTRASIYGWYWLRKYQDWFAENVNLAELPKY